MNNLLLYKNKYILEIVIKLIKLLERQWWITVREVRKEPWWVIVLFYYDVIIYVCYYYINIYKNKKQE